MRLTQNPITDLLIFSLEKSRNARTLIFLFDMKHYGAAMVLSNSSTEILYLGDPFCTAARSRNRMDLEWGFDATDYYFAYESRTVFCFSFFYLIVSPFNNLILCILGSESFAGIRFLKRCHLNSLCWSHR